MNEGGAGNVAFTMSEEARKKISESTKKWISEKGHPLKGVGHTKESIEKMRRNTKKKFGKDNPNYGWKPSKEVLERLANLARERTGEKNSFFRKHHSEENKEKSRKLFGKRVVQYDANTMREIAIYDSTKQAAKELCGNSKRGSDIGKVCNGYVRKDGVRITTALGYKWKWFSPE